MHQFFSALGSRFERAAAERGVAIDAPSLDEPTAAELLELARVVAHTQERRFAPLACFLAGVAVARVTSAQPAIGTVALREYLRAVRDGLEEGPAT